MSCVEPFTECVAAPIRADALEILQVNVGRRCNLGCAHCHLGCGPRRTEVMSRAVMREVARAARAHPFGLVDVTGGAPELNADLPFLVEAVAEAGRALQVRTNLVALLGRRDLVELFRRRGVGLVGSMPCYLEENVRAQRGAGVYEKSIECLRLLNDAGYGTEGGLPLTLVYNPAGASLPGSQAGLEAAYRAELKERFGIVFTRLLTIANIPVGRFGESLAAKGLHAEYMARLREAFNPGTVEHLMCRRQVCVDWDGSLYDCDFNLALGRTLDPRVPGHISGFDPSRLRDREVETGDHCYGCTAGAGSSCGGALA